MCRVVLFVVISVRRSRERERCCGSWYVLVSVPPSYPLLHPDPTPPNSILSIYPPSFYACRERDQSKVGEGGRARNRVYSSTNNDFLWVGWLGGWVDCVSSDSFLLLPVAFRRGGERWRRGSGREGGKAPIVQNLAGGEVSSVLFDLDLLK